MDQPLPADVSTQSRGLFESNMRRLTHDTGRVMLFAGDQKVEHLNDDFFGEGIAPEDNDPRHLFEIARIAGSSIGCLAMQYGMISSWGPSYQELPYLVKLNSKTNLVPLSQGDPVSGAWLGLEHVLRLRKAGLNIAAVGYTVYLGSEFENTMLCEAARLCAEAHWAGLPVVLWVYPRGRSLLQKQGETIVNLEKHPRTIAGAAGVGAALGADFVKVNPPDASDGRTSAEWLRVATEAGGKARVICAGGSARDPELFLDELHEQLSTGGSFGNATGRNIHQRPLAEAVRLCHAIASMTYGGHDSAFARQVYRGAAWSIA